MVAVKAFDYNNPFDLARSFLGRGETEDGKPMCIEPDFEVDVEDVASQLAHAALALEAELAAERRAHATTHASLEAAWAHPSFRAMQADRDRWKEKAAALEKINTFAMHPESCDRGRPGLCPTCTCGLTAARKAAGL
jgi:hypothetical protein